MADRGDARQQVLQAAHPEPIGERVRSRRASVGIGGEPRLKVGDPLAHVAVRGRHFSRRERVELEVIVRVDEAGEHDRVVRDRPRHHRVAARDREHRSCRGARAATGVDPAVGADDRGVDECDRPGGRTFEFTGGAAPGRPCATGLAAAGEPRLAHGLRSRGPRAAAGGSWSAAVCQCAGSAACALDDSNVRVQPRSLPLGCSVEYTTTPRWRSTRAHSRSNAREIAARRASPGRDTTMSHERGGERQRAMSAAHERQVEHARARHHRLRQIDANHARAQRRRAAACSGRCRSPRRAPCAPTPAAAARAPPSAPLPSARCGHAADTSAPTPRTHRNGDVTRSRLQIVSRDLISSDSEPRRFRPLIVKDPLQRVQLDRAWLRCACDTATPPARAAAGAAAASAACRSSSGNTRSARSRSCARAGGSSGGDHGVRGSRRSENDCHRSLTHSSSVSGNANACADSASRAPVTGE